MTIPDKYIRQAYGALLTGIAIGGKPVPIYDKRVPKSVVPIPSMRIIINSQTKKQANTSKAGHDWAVTIELDIIAEFNVGNADSSILDDIEQQINDVIDISGDIDCQPFTIWNTQVDQPTLIDLDTKTQTILRKIVRYQHVMGL